MKKIILFLYPDKFTHFEYFKHELLQLEKKYNFKIMINDLSNILNNKKLNLVWKSKRVWNTRIKTLLEFKIWM